MRNFHKRAPDDLSSSDDEAADVDDQDAHRWRRQQRKQHKQQQQQQQQQVATQTLTVDDLIASHLFKSSDEARKALAVFDVARKEQITRDDLVTSISDILQQRWGFSQTINDREAIANTLSRIISVALFIVAALLIMAVFGVDFQAIVVPFTTSILGLVFIFGNSFKELFECSLWLFNVRAFDVGDKM
jgi:small-conductance mechanosensitive channel